MIPFMKLKWVSLILSILTILGLFYLTNVRFHGFNEGIDFAGGIRIGVKPSDEINIDKIRKVFEKEKIEAAIQMTGSAEQRRIRVDIGAQQEKILTANATKAVKVLEEKELSANAIDYIKLRIANDYTSGDIEKVVFLRANRVGPTVGEYLRKSAIKLLLITLALITVYVAVRFRLNYAAGAMFALIHDLFFTLALIGYLQIPLSIPVVAALLTILGYSINDTIVVFDRIRENSHGEDRISLDRLVDRSIKESLSRTVITSVTTLLSITAVYFLGGEGLRDLSLVLFLGIAIGTYSSIFIASPIVVIGNTFFKRSPSHT